MKNQSLVSSLSAADLGLLSMRLITGLVFFLHGMQKLFGWFGGYGIQGTAGFFESIGIPFPTLNAYLVGTTELLGGLSLILGVGTLLSGPILAITMIVASLTAHSGFVGANGFEYPMTLAFVVAGLALTGPGKLRLPVTGGVLLDAPKGRLVTSNG